MIEDDEDITAYVPLETATAVKEYEAAQRLCYFDNLEREILYMLRKSTPQSLSQLPDVGQGLENRLFEAGKTATSLDELIEMISTKRYTLAHIRRILINLYIGTLQSDLLMPPSHGRILAFNDRGVDIIKAAKEKNANNGNRLAVPFSTDIKELFDNPSAASKRMVQLTTVGSDLYALAARNIARSGTDFTTKIAKLSTVEPPALKEETSSGADGQQKNTTASNPPHIEVTKGGVSPE
jgi:hypothetical protein